ncbi:acyltransferase [Methanolobus sp. ZRKC3]|uniref:acyltransferase n=1 Tax=Methanolobus sp. ZRKC3 TaxID=3125786 RepID=UPI003250D9BB
MIQALLKPLIFGRSTFNNFKKHMRMTYLKKAGVKIGENVHISPKAYIDLHKPSFIQIGDNVKITRWTMILCYDSSKDMFEGLGEAYNRVIIGNNVYIGAHSIVMPGVKIGDNVIVGANSLVNRDVPSNCIVAGTPAKKMRDL